MLSQLSVFLMHFIIPLFSSMTPLNKTLCNEASIVKKSSPQNKILPSPSHRTPESTLLRAPLFLPEKESTSFGGIPSQFPVDFVSGQSSSARNLTSPPGVKHSEYPEERLADSLQIPDGLSLVYRIPITGTKSQIINIQSP